MRNFVLAVVFLAVAMSATGSTLSYDRYNNYWSTTDCAYGPITSCDFSGSWSYGTTTINTSANSDSYNNGIQNVTWIASGLTTTTLDAFGNYRGSSLSADNWGSGWEQYGSTTYTNTTSSSSYADTTGFSELGGASNYTTDIVAGFMSYFYSCDIAGLCTEYVISDSTDDQWVSEQSWWTNYKFGQYQDSGYWSNAVHNQFPSAQLDTFKFNRDGSPLASATTTNAPEADTNLLTGLSLMIPVLYIRYRRRTTRAQLCPHSGKYGR